MEVQELATIVENGFQDLRARIDETNSRIDGTDTRLDSGIESLGSRLDQTNQRIDQTNTRLDRLEERVVHTDGRIAQIRDSQTWTAAEIARLGQQFVSLTGRVTAVDD